MEETTKTDAPTEEDAARDPQLAARMVWGEQADPAEGAAGDSNNRDMKEWVPNVWWNWSPSEEPAAQEAPQAEDTAQAWEPDPRDEASPAPGPVAEAPPEDEDDGADSQPQWRYTLTDHGIEPAGFPEPPVAEREAAPPASASEDLDALFAPAVPDEEHDFRLGLDFPTDGDASAGPDAPATTGSDYDDTTGLDLFAQTSQPDSAPATPAAAPEAEPVDRRYPDLFDSNDADTREDKASWFGPDGGFASSRGDSDGDDAPESWVFTSSRFSGSNGNTKPKAERKRRGPGGRHRRSREDVAGFQATEPEPPADSMGPMPVAIPARRRFGSLLRVVAIALPVAVAGVAYLSFLR